VMNLNIMYNVTYDKTGYYYKVIEGTPKDTLVTLNLTIKQSTTHNLIESVCDSYNAPDGQVYTTSGLKTAIIPNAVGCDSTITIDLTIKEPTTL
jgi:hypothetical protein